MNISSSKSEMPNPRLNNLLLFDDHKNPNEVSTDDQLLHNSSLALTSPSTLGEIQ